MFLVCFNVIDYHLYRVVQVDELLLKICSCFRFLSSSAIHVLYQSARQAATEAAPAAHVAVTAAAPLSAGTVVLVVLVGLATQAVFTPVAHKAAAAASTIALARASVSKIAHGTA